MPVLNPNEISETERHGEIAGVFTGNLPNIPGFNCVRRFTPLVLVAMQESNNPFATGPQGFEAIGVKLLDGGLPDISNKREFALKMLVPTAAVIVLLTCTRENLKVYAQNKKELQSAAMDLTDDSTLDAITAATVGIMAEMTLMLRATAIIDPAEKEPSAAALNGGSAEANTKS